MKATVKKKNNGEYKVTLTFKDLEGVKKFQEVIDTDIKEEEFPRKWNIVKTILESMAVGGYGN